MSAPEQNRHWIEENFSRHLADPDIKALTRALEKLDAHARTLRPRRIGS